MLILKLEWMTTTLTYLKDWTLETRNYNKAYDQSYCSGLGLGVLRNKYIFTPPNVGENKCSGFHVNGISAYGYTHFKRIE